MKRFIIVLILAINSLAGSAQITRNVWGLELGKSTKQQVLNVLKQKGYVPDTNNPSNSVTIKVDNFKSAVDILKRIGYYHLSSYMRLFQEGENHIFKDNVEFADLINLFNFDSELRHITFKAIEKIEVAYRVAISNVMCKKYGSHWFTNKETFKTKIDPNTSQEIDYVEICKKIINKEIKKKDDEYAETFIANYYNKYNEPELPPFWMVVETFTIGSLNKLYQMVLIEEKP